MFILLLLAIFFGALGLMIRFFKWYWLIAGYNTMTKERKSKVDIEELGKFMGNMFFILAGVMAAGSVMAYFEVPGVSFAVPVTMIALIVYMLIKAQQFDAGARNPDGTLNRSTKIILGSIFAFLVFIGVLIYAGTFGSEIVVGAESVQIKGLYGVEIMFADIQDIALEDSMPVILRRTNGFSAGGTLKGHFELQNVGGARLYVNVNNPPFIYIHTIGGLIIVNQEDRQSTEELYGILTSSYRQ